MEITKIHKTINEHHFIINALCAKALYLSVIHAHSLLRDNPLLT